MLIFSTKGRITTANDKTNLIHRFDVPENMKSLKIKYSYSPKILENREKAVEIIKSTYEKYDEILRGRPAEYLPVKNLITLSVDCNGRYIGAAHRQDNEQEHVISSEFSSCGFIKTEVEAGEWDIMLNVHSVSCNVDYVIEVEGEEK
ncbi:MAG: hypothetical protein NC213_08710 [Acetobacter sp.]|nr:hypothetical protein [Bacteroides sp.]MCM1341809.1 hypothetical protein [Acetobacter sp.]MCM1433975.1 hypothetical protein [Clostridiales bacterium]